jgi:hypothetical protein
VARRHIRPGKGKTREPPVGPSFQPSAYGSRMTSTPSLLNTSSKLTMNFESRSRSRNLAFRTSSWSFQARFRAYCTTHSALGL